MEKTKKLPLFIVTGASCVGKSTVCNELFMKEKEYIVMESDLLWNSFYDTPEDNYCEYRRLWMRICADIAQIGKPVVLCGCAIPEQFENHPERAFFTDIYYLAVVCNEETLLKRMKEGRKVSDKNWIKSSVDFNQWLKENAAKTNPTITLLDTSTMPVKDAAAIVDNWILEKTDHYN